MPSKFCVFRGRLMVHHGVTMILFDNLIDTIKQDVVGTEMVERKDDMIVCAAG